MTLPRLSFSLNYPPSILTFDIILTTYLELMDYNFFIINRNIIGLTSVEKTCIFFFLVYLCGEQGWRSGRALASHQCGPGSIPGLGIICGLSLLVLYSAPRGFSPGTPVFLSPLKPTFDLI